MSQVHMAQSACYYDMIGCISHGIAICLQAVRLRPIAELARTIITNSQHSVRDAMCAISFRPMDGQVLNGCADPANAESDSALIAVC